MSKHTTHPHIQMDGIGIHNSHVDYYSNVQFGNWNRHKKRKVPSHRRTGGRVRRWISRHPAGHPLPRS